MRNSRAFRLAVLPIVAIVLAACGSGSQSATEPSAAEEGGTAAGDSVEKIAFFGFWKSNSFTQAALTGVQEAAEAGGMEVVDLTTPEYDGPAQIKAVQDQTVKGDAQMYVVLAADSVGMATAAREAIDAGITVVAGFTPLGPDFTSLEPQVDGLVVVGETPVANGEVLGELALEACADLDPCNIAYLEGLKALPLDNARTEAFVETVSSNPAAEIVSQVEGGYSPDSGKKAAQDALQANPDLHVMVGASQAILGAQTVVDASKVKLIGNGSSKEAFAAVNDGSWFALYNTDVKGIGTKSVELGLKAAAGELEDPSFDLHDMRDPKGTKEGIAGLESTYSDLG